MSFRSAVSILAISVLAIMMSVAGCTNDATSPAGNSDTTTDVASGQLNPGAGDFEIRVTNAEGPDHPFDGPFFLRGSNVRYDESLGALLVDLAVYNAGRQIHPEPVTVTFVRLIPSGVTIQNPDNDEHGPGAMVAFQFENDDAMWTPGEMSLPRTVQFAVEANTSIGFAVRLGVGVHPDGGAIGGIVWHDANDNQQRDRGEEGIGGVDIFLTQGALERINAAEILRRTVTRHDGSYRFDGLRAGTYTIMRGAHERLRATTPPEIEVVLVETGDGVSDLLDVDFGCIAREDPPPQPTVRIGDYIRGIGKYVGSDASTAAATGAITAREVTIYRCRLGDCGAPGVLRGPVTDIDLERRALRVMTEWVSFSERDSVPDDTTTVAGEFADQLGLEEVKIGDRVFALVHEVRDGIEGPLPGLALFPWDAPFDQASGTVRRLGEDPNSPVATLVVLRHMPVIVTEDTKIIVQER